MIVFNNDDEKKEVSAEKIPETPEISTDEPEIAFAQSGESVGAIVEAAEAAEETKKNEKIDRLIEEEFMKQHTAKFHKGNLRSGISFDFDGSIIILGDVNPGAQVKATGNILVLGSLKGVAHAGAGGDKDAYVFALNMNPVQLRIADIITRFPETGRNKNDIVPEYAYVEDGKVYVSTFE